MKIGIIGLGSICRKAYLPIITQLPDMDLYLCTRNEAVLHSIAATHRISRIFSTVEDLVDSGIDCAFVHTATESHYDICRQLLENNIHVYVDKPVSYILSETTALHRLATTKNKIIVLGFNRRYAPMITNLKTLGKPDIVLIQKNKTSLSGTPRFLVYDDFIHVLDTLRFLLADDYSDLSVNYKMSGEKLQNIIVKLSTGTATAIGIMNRTSGSAEEVVEYMTTGKKTVVSGLAHTTTFDNNTATLKEFGDWENTLAKRGFASIIQTFVDRVAKNSVCQNDMDDWLKTHKLCEDILQIIEQS